MASNQLAEKARAYLHELCVEIPDRHTGSEGNQQATQLFAERVASFGFRTECPRFDCIDWTHGDAHLAVEGEPFAALVSPYSLGCDVRGMLTAASTVEELEALDASGKLLLLHGEIAREPLMPKSFTFFNPDSHKRIVQLLEAKASLAIIAATSRNPAMAGGLYPFPMIEDGDFDIPSVYMTDEEGQRLATYVGKQASLAMTAKRIPSSGVNVVARKAGTGPQRVVACAHIDSRAGTPGALDNATGIVTLLLLAELLPDYSAGLGIEIVALNGHEYYSAPGAVQFVRSNEGRFAEIVLGVNLDAAGYHVGNTAYSLYECPAEIAAAVRGSFAAQPGMVEGEQWVQSDHMLFVLNQTPAVAITSEPLVEVETTITHTPKDTPDLVDCDKLVHVALALRDLLLALDKLPA